jgi:hypothetical protein
MGTRLEFQAVLEGLQDGVHVYFQPPPDIQMIFPAIVYNRDYRLNQFADNLVYSGIRRYSVTIIDKDPDSNLVDMVSDLPQARYVRHYTTEGLNHDIINVYF